MVKLFFLLGSLENSLDDKNNFWKNIPLESKQYEEESYQINVVKSIAELEREEFKIDLFEIFGAVSKVLKSLFVNNEYEGLIAHYTNLDVAKLVLTNKKGVEQGKFEPLSRLRLNTINLMNDPEEGMLINKLLCLDHRISTQDSAFIACFTLHHDSLNQFRLYGKEDKEEASGLSLVLDKKFFATEHNAARIYQKEISLDQNADNDKKSKNSLSAMPLYRCIYFDPTSGLVKVAQREEWSFKREFKLEGRHRWYDPNEDAENKWNEYISDPKKGIHYIESKVKQGLIDLSKLIDEIDLGKMHSKEQELLAELLLPLRYLMKHMAFKEEQECRIVYVTKMENSLVNYDGSRFYIEYEPLVMEHLEKIYLAPKAKNERTFMEYLCAHGQIIRQHKVSQQSNGRVQVKISQNPFQ